MRSNTFKILCTLCATAVAIILAIGVGSVSIGPGAELAILWHKLSGAALPDGMDASTVSILWSIRMPRALCAFLVGGILSVCGVVCQSLLQNPLASSYTLGVSSGAALGAAIVILTGVSIPVLSTFLLPLGGFAGALVTVTAVMILSSRIDRGLQNQTIILFGMVVSLFTSAVLTVLTALASEHEHQLIRWQMGSFAGKRWLHVEILAVTALVSLVFLTGFHRELDILSFGDEQAMSLGVDAIRIKRLLIIVSALLTGIAVCFTGTIGFVDLIAPHAVRRVFGPAHRLTIPLSFCVGGGLLCLSDLMARTVLAPQDLPVGAVTALFGAPFFLLLYYRGRTGGAGGGL
ncbi:MAG: iron ABC transporter permease [Butyrivibrio sp.]|nr:iron ABC transporter permease [Butyrivibrio sp.]